jgi:hypothetical protein
MNSKMGYAARAAALILALGLLALPRASAASGDPDTPGNGNVAYAFKIELSFGGVRYPLFLAIPTHVPSEPSTRSYKQHDLRLARAPRIQR